MVTCLYFELFSQKIAGFRNGPPSLVIDREGLNMCVLAGKVTVITLPRLIR
jgi:hypothetical protein